MYTVGSTPDNTVVIRRDPGVTSLIRSFLGISTSLCLFCTVGWYMLLLAMELFSLNTETSLPLQIAGLGNVDHAYIYKHI